MEDNLTQKKEKHVRFDLNVEETTIAKDKNKSLDAYEEERINKKQRKHKDKKNRERKLALIEANKNKINQKSKFDKDGNKLNKKMNNFNKQTDKFDKNTKKFEKQNLNFDSKNNKFNKKIDKFNKQQNDFTKNNNKFNILNKKNNKFNKENIKFNKESKKIEKNESFDKVIVSTEESDNESFSTETGKQLRNKNIKAEKKSKKLSKRSFIIDIDTKELNEVEKKIIKDGAFIDKINLVTLLILKNNDNNLLSLLFDKIPSFRNDDKFYALKNIKDLLKEDFTLTPVNKLKFKRILETETKNDFIKQKILNLIKELLKKGILMNDLLYIYINKLGDKKEVYKEIYNFLEEIYPENKNLIIKEMISFYDKCTILRGKTNVVKFFAINCLNEDLNYFYSSFEELEFKNETEIVKLFYYFLLGMKNRVLKISFRKLKCLLKTEKLILLALYAIKNNFKEKLNSTLLTVINYNYKVSDYELLNFIYESVEDKEEIIIALFKSPNIINVKFLCGVLMLAKASNVELPMMSGLLKIHYHPLISNIVNGNINNMIDPYDEVEFKKGVYEGFRYL